MLRVETASCLCYNYWKLYFNQEIAQSKSHTSIKNGPHQAYFCLFLFFSHHMDKFSTKLTINDKSIDGVLGSLTRGGRMEGADKSIELWRHFNQFLFNHLA